MVASSPLYISCRTCTIAVFTEQLTGIECNNLSTSIYYSIYFRDFHKINALLHTVVYNFGIRTGVPSSKAECEMSSLEFTVMQYLHVYKQSYS